PANLQVDQAQLGVKESQSLALVGGNININGGLLRAQNGRVELGSVSEGFVKIKKNR
ncbi:hypothetical protein M595_6536, partial [Lyngbya aestuarii BL J]